MMTNEKRVQKVLDALLSLKVGARVRVLACDHKIKPGSISKRVDCAGLEPWMVGATGMIIETNARGGAAWFVRFDKRPDINFPREWWVGTHQVELL